MTRRLLVAALVGVALAAAGALAAHGRGPGRAAAAPSPAFVDDQACAACHETQYRAWARSHHARAMQRADATTVLGDFGGTVFHHAGVTSRFFTRDGRLFVATEGPDGASADFEVAYTFGVEPLQQYLIALPGGRLQALTIAWNTRERRWFSLYPDRPIAPGEPLHWTGRYQNVNLMCAECHTTSLRKGYDAATDSYATTWQAINVGCQSCHGPGAAHGVWARAPRAERDADRSMGLVVPRTADWRAQVDACGRCHSRRVRLGAEERAGRPLLDEFRPELLRGGLYHADGQQLDEVYEWGSYLQSRMYQVGVRCTECHDPHGATKAADDAVCTRCHRAAPDPRFPMLKAKAYDTRAHHFHKPGTPAARCVSCHMPAKRFLVVDARRDHSVRVPRPDLSVALGTPNACGACHADRSAQWAASAMDRWYGRAWRRPHHAAAIAAGRKGARDAAPRLAAVARDPARPPIVRATALELLGGYGAVGAGVIAAATRDDDALVRMAAAAAVRGLPPRARVASGAPLLVDPIRAVRVEAARALAGVPRELLDASQRDALDAALGELTAAHAAMADLPASHASLAAVERDLRRREDAERSYATALRMDPYFLPARMGLVALLKLGGRGSDAERTLREGLALTPTEGDLHYSLGLLLAEDGRLAEAADALREASRLLPDRARVRYNLGLALRQLGRRREAEAALLRADALDGGDAQTAYALAVLYVEDHRLARALPFARRAAALAPADAAARQLVERLERQLGSRAPKS